ncbi:MAG: L-threonylcarbamoyladenylate synthase [Ottowia sp.]|nr:L-threonylcarbamoyladenylate synthase [Ottowia sp.]
MILPGTDPEAVARAAAALAAGDLVGLPTETVYGLAANAEDDAAVQQVYAVKGRPADHPLIVHVIGVAEVAHFSDRVPDFARRLMQALWPGPLTLILPRRAGVAAAAAGQNPTIGLRCPAHPVARALLDACAAHGIRGLAAPSANRFGRVSPTTAQHVADEFGDGLLVLDGGACSVGIESAIVDCTRGAPVLLRPGHLTREVLARAAGCPLRSPDALTAPDPRASGTLPAHYAPRARVRLMPVTQLRAALAVLGGDAGQIGVWARSSLTAYRHNCVLRRMPADAATAAQELFATLRAFDDAGVRLIWIETPPADPAWEGVLDRLQRAAVAG